MMRTKRKRRRVTKCRHGHQGRAGAILSILGSTPQGLMKAMRTRTRRRASGLGRRGLPHQALGSASGSLSRLLATLRLSKLLQHARRILAQHAIGMGHER